DFKNPKNIVLPFMAALGGILIPAMLFALVNIGDAYTLQGWAIPTATDTAFALAILMMCGKHIPSSLKIFLLSLAIFDDVGAILIIAIFYTTKLSIVAFV
ncbi:Na(+)/H(+) antiporter NhaA, partial [Campylobacter jejuni]|nr:Na(+)/H(+) antiporter NhaA [Campylobacter jejuni]